MFLARGGMKNTPAPPASLLCACDDAKLQQQYGAFAPSPSEAERPLGNGRLVHLVNFKKLVQ